VAICYHYQNFPAAREPTLSEAFRISLQVEGKAVDSKKTSPSEIGEEGIARLAAVYVFCLFGYIIWIGLLISWPFFHGVLPPMLKR
jgi:hypothetical protein